MMDIAHIILGLLATIAFAQMWQAIIDKEAEKKKASYWEKKYKEECRKVYPK